MVSRFLIHLNGYCRCISFLTLSAQFHGSSRDAVLQAAAAFREAAAPFELIEMTETAEEKEREELWKARHGAYFACNALRPVHTFY